MLHLNPTSERVSIKFTANRSDEHITSHHITSFYTLPFNMYVWCLFTSTPRTNNPEKNWTSQSLRRFTSQDITEKYQWKITKLMTGLPWRKFINIVIIFIIIFRLDQENNNKPINKSIITIIIIVIITTVIYCSILFRSVQNSKPQSCAVNMMLNY